MSNKTEEQLFQAAEAQRLLDNPLIKAFFVELDAGIIDRKRMTPLEEDGLQRKLDMLLIVSGKFQRMFEEHIITGKLARQRLKDKTLFNRKGL